MDKEEYALASIYKIANFTILEYQESLYWPEIWMLSKNVSRIKEEWACTNALLKEACVIWIIYWKQKKSFREIGRNKTIKNQPSRNL